MNNDTTKPEEIESAPDNFAGYRVHWNEGNPPADVIKIHYETCSYIMNQLYHENNHTGGYLPPVTKFPVALYTPPFATYKEAEDAARKKARELRKKGWKRIWYRKCRRCNPQ